MSAFRFAALAIAFACVSACGNGDTTESRAGESTSALSTTESVMTTVTESTTGQVSTTMAESTTVPATATTSTTTAAPAPTTTTAPPTTVAAATMISLELVDCDRFGIGFRVDQDAAQRYVAGDHQLLIVQDQALFALQALSCGDLVTDGVSHGAGHFSTAWLATEPSAQAVTLPPGSDLVAVPTDSFYVPLFHTDNEGFQTAASAFGIPMTLAELMTFDPLQAGEQTGSAVDSQFDPPLSYAWTVENVNEGDTDGLLGLHTLYGPDVAGAPLTYYGEFLHQAGFVGNVGRLALGPGSAFEDLLGSDAAGPVNGDPVTVTMVAFRN